MASKYKQLIMLGNLKRLAQDMSKDFSMMMFTDKQLCGNAICYILQTRGIRAVMITNNDVTIVTNVKVYEDQNQEPKMYYSKIKYHTPMLDYDKMKGICYASVKKLLAGLPDVEKQMKEIRMKKKLNDLEKDFHDGYTIDDLNGQISLKQN